MRIFQAITNVNSVVRFYDKTQIKLNVLIAFDNVKRQTDKLTRDYREMIESLYLESGGYSKTTGKIWISRYQAAFFHLFISSAMEC